MLPISTNAHNELLWIDMLAGHTEGATNAYWPGDAYGSTRYRRTHHSFADEDKR